MEVSLPMTLDLRHAAVKYSKLLGGLVLCRWWLAAPTQLLYDRGMSVIFNLLTAVATALGQQAAAHATW